MLAGDQPASASTAALSGNGDPASGSGDVSASHDGAAMTPKAGLLPAGSEPGLLNVVNAAMAAKAAAGALNGDGSTSGLDNSTVPLPSSGADGELSSIPGGAGSDATASTLQLEPTAAVHPDHDENDRRHAEAVRERRMEIHRGLVDRDRAPRGYWSTSPKEEKMLKYVENFRLQYATLFPHRTELFLTPENEFGVRKFVCTTIRPSQLGFKELYDYRSCARFVADYIAYQPLDPPYELPQRLNSPTYTLTMQTGNCFDMAVILTSLLRGAGFDAFVVSGYAARTVTLMDETHLDIPVPKLMADAGFPDPTASAARAAAAAAGAAAAAAKGGRRPSAASLNSSKPSTAAAPPAAAAAEPVEPKYKVKTKAALKSRFLALMEAKKAAEEEKRARALQEQLTAQYAVNDDDDEIAGLRVHAWVLVLPGKRDIAEAFFIEPSTGKVHDLEDPKYLGVESVFSSTNYWVNMQKCLYGLKGISFDLGDSTKWEFIFMQNSQPTLLPGSAGGAPGSAGGAGGAGGGGADEEEDDGEAGDGGDTELFDLPPSWVAKLAVSKEQFASRCPSGAKVQTWRNAKLEVFAAYHRPDGMVARVTLFSDPRRNVTGEIHERFENRRDRLVRRVRVPARGVLHEFFDRGRPLALMEHVMENGRTVRMRFFPGARSDGLYDRVETGTKIMERFEDRSDRLVYRSVTHELVGDADDEPVVTAPVTPAPGDDAASAAAAAAGRTSAAPGTAAGGNGGGAGVSEQHATVVKMTEKYARRRGNARPTFPFMPTDVISRARLAKRARDRASADGGAAGGEGGGDTGDAGSSLDASLSGKRGTDEADEEEDEEDLEAAKPRSLFGGRDVAKRVFQLRDDRIRLVYHADPGAIVAAWREFRKPSPEQKTSFMDLTTAFDTRPPMHPLKKQHLYAKLCELLKAEQACMHAVKASDREIKEILMARQTEERGIQLAVSLFDTIRNKTVRNNCWGGSDGDTNDTRTQDIASEMEKESQKQAEEASKEASVDYLSPFLLNVGNAHALTREEASAVREACLKALKERLIEKANIIQRRYEEETAAYQRRQQLYSKNAEGMSPQETDEYVAFCNEALFRIHVLEKRLARHKETAPELYLAMDRRLKSDPRLARAL
ncbi:hypothetical protein H9P43_004442 [Blastocladiella emersonii ATCC 22665]|nr:hypothetical protein H9P43_004442 [Blastocladiella emersonii ATCC 22665]